MSPFTTARRTIYNTVDVSMNTVKRENSCLHKHEEDMRGMAKMAKMWLKTAKGGNLQDTVKVVLLFNIS